MDEQMSTEEREEIKRLLKEELDYLVFYKPDFSERDVDDLNIVLDALDELDPLPDVPALDTEEGLRRLHEALEATNNAHN